MACRRHSRPHRSGGLMMSYAACLKANSDPKLMAHVEPHLEGLEVLPPWPYLTYSSATPGAKEIFLAPVVGLITLATAFHEIGHIKTWQEGVRDRMWHEERAWGWARENCPFWNKRTDRFVFYCLRSYKHGPSKTGRWAEHEYTRMFVNELRDAGFPPDLVGPIPPRPKLSRRKSRRPSKETFKPL